MVCPAPCFGFPRQNPSNHSLLTERYTTTGELVILLVIYRWGTCYTQQIALSTNCAGKILVAHLATSCSIPFSILEKLPPDPILVMSFAMNSFDICAIVSSTRDSLLCDYLVFQSSIKSLLAVSCFCVLKSYINFMRRFTVGKLFLFAGQQGYVLDYGIGYHWLSD